MKKFPSFMEVVFCRYQMAAMCKHLSFTSVIFTVLYWFVLSLVEK